MSRPRRISRSLIGLLAVTIVLGLVFYINNVSRTRAQPSDAAPAAPQTVVSIVGQPVGPPTSTPRRDIAQPTRPAPATQPISVTRTPTQSPRPVLGTTPGGSAAPPPASSTLLKDARTLKAAGDLIVARTTLNDALNSHRLTPAESSEVKKLLAEINQVLVFSPKYMSGDEFASSYTVRSGELLRSIADRNDVPWELLARINGLSDPRKLRAGQTIKLIKGPFHAVVTKSKYVLDVYLGPPGERGSVYVTSFAVGLGADDSTPSGTWIVETHKKIKNPTYFSPRGEGVIDADDPNNPLGERWIGLTGIDGQAVGKQSYGIHGTIEPHTIGRQASMGCIRLMNEDVELLFDMLVEGKSTVVVKD